MILHRISITLKQLGFVLSFLGLDIVNLKVNLHKKKPIYKHLFKARRHQIIRKVKKSFFSFYLIIFFFSCFRRARRISLYIHNEGKLGIIFEKGSKVKKEKIGGSLKELYSLTEIIDQD